MRYKLCYCKCLSFVGNLSNDTCLSTANGEAIEDNNSVLSLVKLTRSGLLLFTLPTSSCLNTVNIVSNIIQSLETGSSRSLQSVIQFILHSFEYIQEATFSFSPVI